ncbi:bifunctional 2-C-methyl-D-erythritol 4-phosphate cytidylyltransferase/2-C-methyl-D-erythritol 2,4-cyclodiphosphate synthase [Aestuariivita boseongensis]|uniref:bifunctional 2-C-methyl-D-erythritol 4-phosphate cytidylyltransferase/2-C-methyl-D-erythritol 2,4-cyclodiphosphate synthase n=1 Tax=Aestuariivita boseongensis TaxID=1470562 RepID=UPI0009E22DA8|nr:bifunctional 2-C-methyl-D-erythritol 4-phosphate cytidylyltransferase/2-C-methyl-D-erythritol 2,4-cyclodiphosphate synthase [Aestuariivita boseongensis]
MPKSTAAIIVAAGRGTRAGGGLPKQWRPLAGQTVAAHTIAAFARHPRINHIVLVVHPDDLDSAPWPGDMQAEIVTGADTRRGSVMAGLEVLEGRFDQVLIHDAARPCVSAHVIDGVLAALEDAPAAAPALAVVDALWTGEGSTVTGTQSREGLYRAQTPQGFDLTAILNAHRCFDEDAADDVEIARRAGLPVTITEGDENNLKITRAEDFARAEAILGQIMDIRLGNGYDVHRFGPGDHVILCGVKVPFDRALQGHSDADVGMHAVTDAIYGALAEGDIGQHFPPSDPQWKGAASEIFLRHAVDLAAERGFRISNVDCTLVCEFPKIGPHAAKMRETMARLMGLEPSQVSVKATTSERLGFTGRGEGIASLATVALVSK